MMFSGCAIQFKYLMAASAFLLVFGTMMYMPVFSKIGLGFSPLALVKGSIGVRVAFGSFLCNSARYPIYTGSFVFGVAAPTRPFTKSF
ncbi:hypothetical protein D3C76_1210960 [compost metagenome]